MPPTSWPLPSALGSERRPVGQRWVFMTLGKAEQVTLAGGGSSKEGLRGMVGSQGWCGRLPAPELVATNLTHAWR